MKFTRLFTGADQKSYFEDLEIPLNNSKFGTVSVPLSVENMLFGEIEDINEIDWHNSPCPQYIIMLEGSMEIEIADGTKRIFNVGDVLLAEDTTGQGHITRAASQGKRRYLAILLK